ncbi:MAG: exodeoxyribonuclease VII small subunit [Clostridia bacterium]|nr:exodeoxyribonuclease VII small subunit [Clostridia bacterium]
MKKSSETETKLDLTFEQAAAELDGIVAKLGDGSVTLDETIKLYEKGVELSNHCTKLLNDYDGRIEQAMKKKIKVGEE